jgi:hypothetical protein
MMFLLFIGAKNAKGDTIVDPECENFQRPQLIDCQTYVIPKFKGVHQEVNSTICFYEGNFINRDGSKTKVIIPVVRNRVASDVKILLKGE